MNSDNITLDLEGGEIRVVFNSKTSKIVSIDGPLHWTRNQIITAVVKDLDRQKEESWNQWKLFDAVASQVFMGRVPRVKRER